MVLGSLKRANSEFIRIEVQMPARKWSTLLFTFLYAVLFSMPVTSEPPAKDARPEWCKPLKTLLAKLTIESGSPPDVIYVSHAHDTEKLASLSRSDFKNLVIVDDAAFSDSTVQAALQNNDAPLFLGSKISLPEVEKYLGRKVRKIRFVVLLPSDAIGVKNVWGNGLPGKGIQASVRYMDTIQPMFRELKSCRILDNTMKDSALPSLRAEIEKAEKDELLVVVGHNEGGEIKCPDGSTIKLSEVNHKFSNGKLGIVLTCNSMKYPRGAGDVALVTTRDLELDEIAMVADALESWDPAVEKDGTTKEVYKSLRWTLIKLQIAMDTIRGMEHKKDVRVRAIVTLGVGGATITGGTVLFYSSPTDRKAPPKR
jgi:hypothetical protein